MKPSNPRLIRRYLQSASLSRSPFPKASSLHSMANQKALELFQQASQRIPAYKDFLKKHRLKPRLVKKISDFSQVPLTTKKNYIYQYPLDSRCWDGQITQTHTIASSSGSTGKPVFWPRFLQQEIDGAKIHELILGNILGAKNQKTLFINSFGLGNWIAGMYTQFCVYLNQLKGYPITLASPGFSEQETFNIITNFSHYFDQTIIAGHPPVLKMMLDNGPQYSVNWKNLNIKFLGAGEGFSESWRDYVLSVFGKTNPFDSIVNIYGSADAGLMGFETPLSITIHRLVSQQPKLNHLLFQTDRIPYVYQYDPRFKYFQSENEELVITTNATMPLIRYNIQDHAHLLTYTKLNSRLKKNGYSCSQLLNQHHLNSFNWPLPFVYMFGRKYFTITLNAVNIYPENIKSALEHKSLQPSITGRFIATTKHDPKQDQYLELKVELRPGVSKSSSLKDKIVKRFVTTLRNQNSEYSVVENRFGSQMHPKVLLFRYHHPIHFPEGKVKKMS